MAQVSIREMIESLEKVTVENFRTLGAFIGRRPNQIIATMLTISSLTSLGIFRLDEISNVRTEYSPSDAPSRIEHAVAMNFLGQVRVVTLYIDDDDQFMRYYWELWFLKRNKKFAGIFVNNVERCRHLASLQKSLSMNWLIYLGCDSSAWFLNKAESLSLFFLILLLCRLRIPNMWH